MISLKRSIRVRTFEAEATVAVGRERPEFLAVARLAADLGHPIGGREISRELLGNLPEQVGWRVLERALGLGLLERPQHRGPATLSESGRAMLERGVVLVPEEGVWRFYLIEDELVPSPLVHIQRLETDHAGKERGHVYERKRSRAGRPDAGKRLPEALEVMRGRLLESVSATTGGFEVRELGARGEYGPRGELVVSLEWQDGGRPVVRLRGCLPSDQGEAESPIDAQLQTTPALDELSYDRVWAALVSSATDVGLLHLFEWRERAGALVLPTNMGLWPEAARRSFMTDLEVQASSVASLGQFDKTTLEGVLLVAESKTAAQRWAEWLLWDGISGYVVPSDIEAIRQTVSLKFPLHHPNLPDAQGLLERARKGPQDPTSRYILAPSDLGLWSSK